MMDKETWMDAHEAKKLGFVDEVTDAQDVAACFDLAAFRNAPAGLRFDNAAGSQSPKDKRSSMPADLTPEQRLQLAQAQAQENFQALVAARTEIAGLKGQVTNLTKERDDAKAEVIVKNNELKAEQDSREETIKKQVTDRLADAGTDPVKRDPKAGAASDTKMRAPSS
jgi:enoyl-CoA hydratase/carnithine racemase